MPATRTLTNHGAVSALTTAVTALRAGRLAAGFGNPVIAGAVSTTDYSDVYEFTNGSGTFSKSYLRFYGASSGTFQEYQTYQNIGEFGALIGGGGGTVASVGNDQTRFNIRDGSNYRSLSFKPASGSAYGIHIYQKFDNNLSSWQTVLGEVFIKAQNKPSSFNENLAASTSFIYYDTFVIRRPLLEDVNFYDGPKWFYSLSPYANWAGSNPSGGYDLVAMYTRNCMGTSSYANNDGTLVQANSTASNNSLTSTLNSLTASRINNSATTRARLGTSVDIFAAACEPMALGVWNLDSQGKINLAGPFTLKNRMRPIGTANNDILIGPALSADTEVIVSPTERYSSIGGSLFVRLA
jgi:hypothetical protein